METARIVSPVAAPQAPVFVGDRLWLSSMDEPRIVALDPATFTIVDERVVPGTAWGLSHHAGRLVATCGIGPNDDRSLFRGDDEPFTKIADCPDFTGSFLASDGANVLLGQWYNRRVLRLDVAGAVLRTYPMPRQVCGLVVDDGALYAMTVDDETTDDYTLVRVDLASGAATDLARVPFKARGLAKRGTTFLTNHRERDRLVTFTLPA